MATDQRTTALCPRNVKAIRGDENNQARQQANVRAGHETCVSKYDVHKQPPETGFLLAPRTRALDDKTLMRGASRGQSTTRYKSYPIDTRSARNPFPRALFQARSVIDRAKTGNRSRSASDLRPSPRGNPSMSGSTMITFPRTDHRARRFYYCDWTLPEIQFAVCTKNKPGGCKHCYARNVRGVPWRS